MQPIRQRITELWQVETGLLVSVLTIASLLLVFGLIADEVMGGSTLAFDRHVMLAFRGDDPSSGLIGPHWLPEMARDVTALGSFAGLGIVMLAVVGYLLIDGRHASAWLVLASVLGGVVINNLLKVGFARPRPDFFEPAAKVFTASFPSGHAALSAITYLTLAALLARTTQSRALRTYFVTMGIVLTFLIGVSRIYLGVHYPTDVIAGWCVGSAWALACWAVMTRLQSRGRVEPPESS